MCLRALKGALRYICLRQMCLGALKYKNKILNKKINIDLKIIYVNYLNLINFPCLLFIKLIISILPLFSYEFYLMNQVHHHNV